MTSKPETLQTQPCIHEITSEHELNAALSADSDVLVWFTTSWCGPCQMLAPHIEAFSAIYRDRVRVVAIDGDGQPELCQRFQVEGFPTLTLFHRGMRVWQRIGALEMSPEALAATFVPLLDRVATVQLAPDREPRSVAPRPARVVQIPEFDPVSVRVRVLRSLADAWDPDVGVGPGSLELSEGELLRVEMSADFRRDPALDLTVLADFEADAIDVLAINAGDVTLHDLTRFPSLRAVCALELPVAAVTESRDVGDHFARLATIAVTPVESAHQAAPAAPPRVFVDFSWMAPELRDVPHWEPPSTLAVGGARSIVDGEFDADAAHGTVVLHFTSAHSEACQAIRPLLGELREPVRVLVVDKAQQGLLDRYDVQFTPTLVILHDGEPIWRTTQVDDEATFADLFLPALAEAQRSGAAARRLPPVAPRPRRTLQLPAGPIAYSLKLHAPGRPSWEATRILAGGAVDVPAGWRVALDLLTPGRRDPASGPTGLAELLAPFGPDDVDELVTDLRADDRVEELAHLTGLRKLAILEDPDTSEDAIAPLATFRWLRHLTVGLMRETSVHARLRASLVDTVVNECWSGIAAPAAVAASETRA